MPTAFSPNSDAKNDHFNALVFGPVQTFELTVYDRWGHAVFRSTDAAKSWNGKVGATEQATGTYVWTCRYTTAGEKEKLQKDTVMLIR